MFQAQFAPLVKAKTKLQTVRPKRKRPVCVGDRLSLREWTGKPYRSKQRILCEASCTKVQSIDISKDRAIWLDDFRIKFRSEAEAFSRADGFASPEAMHAWFEKTHDMPFSGTVIHWE
jgi:hypothetical protein